jgi:hypothetical protein
LSDDLRTAAKATAIFAIVIVLIALLGRAVDAGEIEANVIDATFDEWAIGTSTSADLVDVWLDTQTGSDCEEYASATAFIAMTSDSVKDVEPEDWSDFEIVSIMAAGLLFNDYQPLYNDCLNEE